MLLKSSLSDQILCFLVSSCDQFVKKWFNHVEYELSKLKPGSTTLIGVKFTLVSHDSRGLVGYASSLGIDSFLRSVLFYSSETEGPHKKRTFSSVDLMNPRPFAERVPVLSYLFSNRRKGRLIIERSGWGPSDKRQIFNVDAPDYLYLSVSHHSNREIVVTGFSPPPKRIAKTSVRSRRRKKSFEFVATCLNENFIYGLVGSTVYILSFNEFFDVPV
jgi:hypothetical protein